MVTTSINISKSNQLKYDDYVEMDNCIDELITKHSNNAQMMNLMALEASSLAKNVNSRSSEQENQSFLKRAFKDLTGSNHKVTARSQRDLAESQYLGQQMLNKLAENNLMTYQMVVTIGDNLNQVASDVNNIDSKLVQYNKNLTTFFNNMREKLEERFANVERTVDMLTWARTLKFVKIYQGKTVQELNKIEVIVGIANSFYNKSQQNWDEQDLHLLKSGIEEAGYSPDENIILKDVFKEYQVDNSLLQQLFLGIDGAPELNKATEMTPTLMAFNKLDTLSGEESHLIDTIKEFSPKTTREEASLTVTTKFVTEQCNQNIDKEITFFDAIMHLIEDLTIYDTLKYNEQIRKDLGENTVQKVSAEKLANRDYETYNCLSDSEEGERVSTAKKRQQGLKDNNIVLRFSDMESMSGTIDIHDVWVKIGDIVDVGEILFTGEGETSLIVYESKVSGRVSKVNVKIEDKVTQHSELLEIETLAST